MLGIVLDEGAIHRLMTDPVLRDWHDGLCGRRLPILRHHHRHTIVSVGGAVIERFNFFLPTAIDPHDAAEMDGLVFAAAVLPNGRTILVGGDVTVMATTVMVGWSMGMFTRRNGLRAA